MGKAILARTGVVLLCTSSLLVSFAQVRKISGTVKDDKGSPVLGATVSVKGIGLN